MKELEYHNATVKSVPLLSKLVRANNVIIFSLRDSDFLTRIVDNTESAARIKHEKHEKHESHETYQSHERIQIPLRSDDVIEHLFLDRTGCHCIVSTVKGENNNSKWLDLILF